MTTQSTTDLPIPLAGEADHIQDMPQDRDYYEDNGFMLLAESGDDDICLWTSAFIFRSPEGGQWLVRDGRMQCTFLIVSPKERRGKGLYDNDFVREGYHYSDYESANALGVIQKPDRVIWDIGQRQYICAPPVWQVKGSHAGVDLDLRMEQSAPAIWQWGPWESCRERGEGGFEVFVKGSGTIKVDGATYRIEKAHGLHEHALLGQSWPLTTTMREHPFYWTSIHTDDLRVFHFQVPSKGIDAGLVRVDNRTLNYMPGSSATVSFVALEHWQDPRSGLNIPSKWHLTMSSPEGLLDAGITGHGRGYYHYNERIGLIVSVWILGVANGAFDFPDGRRIPVKDGLACVNWGRTILVAKESLRGPIL